MLHRLSAAIMVKYEKSESETVVIVCRHAVSRGRTIFLADLEGGSN